MNKKLLSIEVHPAYGQVDVMDKGTVDTPLFETGREAVVCTPHAIAALTRMDTDGEVLITVEIGEEPLSGELIFEGLVEFQSGEIEVGSLVNGELTSAGLGEPGLRNIRIFAEPKTSAARIGVLVSA